MDILKVLTPSKDLNGEHTHVSMGDVKGCWYLSSEKNQEFYHLYSQLLKQKTKISIAEKPGEFVPLLVDIDLKKESSDSPPPVFYTLEEVKSVVEVFQKAICENVNLNLKKLTNKNLRCILLEKEASTYTHSSKTMVKKGFHLHFPFLFLSKTEIKQTFMPKVKKMIDEINEVPFKQFTNLPSTVIDDITSKYWLMYGSSKEGSNEPYLITKIFDHELREITLFRCFRSELCLDGSAITESNVESQLPLLLSIIPKPEILTKKTFFLKEKPINLLSAIKELNGETKTVEKFSAKEIEKMKTLTSFLSKSRADDYSQWWNVGITLFNIGASGECEEEAFEAWKLFSAQSDKYNEDECYLVWNEMSKKTRTVNIRTMGSLVYMAKTDNPIAVKHYLLEEQMNITSGTFTDVKKLHIPETDYEIASMFVAQHEDEYLNGSNGWYKFNGNIWINLEVASRHLREPLVILSKAYLKLIPFLESTANQESDEGYDAFEDENCGEDVSRLVKGKVKMICALKRKCQNNASQLSIIKIIEDKIGVDRLSEKLDRHKHLIAFKNGVFDLSAFIFRQGLPEDYITKQMSVEYKSSYSMESPEVVEMLEFFSKIFPDKELFDYFMLENCEMFFGGNRDKILQIWTGDGDNGKSVTNKIIETMFGKLAIKFPKGMITGDTPKAGACFPELTRAHGGIRWAVVDEFAPDETLNAGAIKYLIGGDKLYARDIHQKGKDVIDLEPFFKLIFVCNTIPTIRNPDNATWSKIRVVPFESTFKDEVEKMSKEEQVKKKVFLKDTSFSEKETIMKLGEALAWYLIEIFVEKEKRRIDARVRGKTFRIRIPAKVSEATELYKAQGNAIADYFNDKFEKTDIVSDTVSSKLYYQDFVLWFSQTHANKNVNIDKKKFVKLFTVHAGGDLNTGICKYTKNKDLDDVFEQ